MREWIQFVSGYPLWVKVAIGLLVATVVLLLIAFAPQGNDDKPETPAPNTDAPLKVGTAVVLDLSDDQGKWNGLTSWASASRLGIVEQQKALAAPNLPEDGLGVLVLPLPYHTLISDSKARAIKSWVERGGGLLVLGYYAADTHHGSNISRLTREWGVSFSENLLMPSGATQLDTRRHVFAAEERLGVTVPVEQGTSRDAVAITAGVSALHLLSAASIDVEHAVRPLLFKIEVPTTAEIWEPKGPRDPDGMRPIIEEWVQTGHRPVAIAVGFAAGRGKVAVIGTWKVAAHDYSDNLQFVQNVINWLRP